MTAYENLSDEELITHIEQTEKLDRADVNELIARFEMLSELEDRKEYPETIQPRAYGKVSDG